MSRLRLLTEEERGRLVRYAALVVTSGLIIMVIPTLIGSVVIVPTTSVWTAVTALMVLLSTAAFFASYSYGSPGLIGVLEQSLSGLRVQVTERIAAAGLRDVETFGAAEPIYTTDLENLGALFAWGSPLVQLGAMLVGVLLYVGYLSLATLLLLGLLAVPLWPLLVREFAHSREAAQKLSADSAEFQRLLGQAIDGFAQLHVDNQTREALFAEIQSRCKDLEQQGQGYDGAVRRTTAIGWYLVSGAIGFVLFLLPNFGALDVPRAYQLALILNLIDAPLLIFASQLHLMVRARISYRNLQELDDRLPPEPATVAGEQPTTFSQIALVEADFHYPSQGGKQFGVGPISFSFGPGEIVFITGENGSGKTTLMKLLAGLYPSQKGALLLNGARLAADKLSHYRGLFSTIFSDNVLLRQLYDETVDPAQVTALLRRFNLRSSTDFVDGCFTSTDLSSGQARRLAMVVALLEDRPILLLDEWTAHQDPERRRFFYEELLPELRQRGKTIIAVSHDDRFFHCADRRIQLASGQLQESSC